MFNLVSSFTSTGKAIGWLILGTVKYQYRQNLSVYKINVVLNSLSWFIRADVDLLSITAKFLLVGLHNASHNYLHIIVVILKH